MTTAIFLRAILALVMILATQGLIKTSWPQNKKEQIANRKPAGVLLQEEKGPSGHSTIGVVESSIESEAGKTLALKFSRLMIWNYDAADDTPPPEQVENLDGRKVKLTGFMYPLQQGDAIQYFCLLRTTQTCCYGPRPQFNQYVFVEMDKPTPFHRLDPVACVGKFRVEPTPDEGYIYRMVGEKCESISGKKK